MRRDRSDDALRVNLSAPFYLAQAVIVPMTTQGCGRIVNIGSATAAMGNPAEAAYGAAKADDRPQSYGGWCAACGGWCAAGRIGSGGDRRQGWGLDENLGVARRVLSRITWRLARRLDQGGAYGCMAGPACAVNDY